MRKIPFYVVDAFTSTPFQGNPAGVFFDAETLTGEEMRRLAGEVSLESAFVLAPTDDRHDFGLRYYTGVTEVPYCGHATLAAVTALVASGRVAVGQTLRLLPTVGLLTVETAFVDGKLLVTQAQRPPQFDTPLGAEIAAEVAAALGVPVVTDLPVQVISTGSRWLYVPVASRADVDKAPASFPAITDLSRRLDTHGIYIFTVEKAGGIRVWSRCFAPIAGLNEDPVTGSASGGLGAYLWKNGVLPVDGGEITTSQGYAGGRGGEVALVVEINDKGVSIWITGTATILAEGAFTL